MAALRNYVGADMCCSWGGVGLGVGSFSWRAERKGKVGTYVGITTKVFCALLEGGKEEFTIFILHHKYIQSFCINTPLISSRLRHASGPVEEVTCSLLIC